MEKHVHIISFDIPYPANYGGVIDVFYKIKNLHRAGVKITLHCFEYGREEQAVLKKYCQQVYYYKRNISFINQCSTIPFIVKSRISDDLIANLIKDTKPILFEGLHTCFYLNDKRLENRVKIYRESNIEHDYYNHLAASEKILFRKMYFQVEAIKLKKFQKQLQFADYMLVVSTTDKVYLQKAFPEKKIDYLPSFHAFDEIQIKTGKGDYILYHGNLQVAENKLAVEYLIKNVFSKIRQAVIIAGLNPSEDVCTLIKDFPHIKLVANPDDDLMQTLIEEAQIHCLYTHQATGLKLKLLNVLYRGRFCICNEAMLAGTHLQQSCIVANTAGEMIQAINQTFTLEFKETQANQRKQALSVFDNQKKTVQLISYL